MRGISSRYTARLAASLVAIVLAGCGGGGGSGDPPNIGLTVTPPSIALGASSTLSWTSSGAATCQASGAWSGARPVIGSETVKSNPGVTAAFVKLGSFSSMASDFEGTNIDVAGEGLNLKDEFAGLK